MTVSRHHCLGPAPRQKARRRVTRLLAAVLVGLIGLVGLAGCSDPKTPEVRLGCIATFSGDDFRQGRDALVAARFAVQTALAQKRPTIKGQPCRIQLLVRDDKGSPEEAAQRVRELALREHVTAIIGPLSSELAEAAAIAAEAMKIPLVAPAATADVVTAGRPHIFRIPFTDTFQGMVLGRLAVRDLKGKQAAVVANADDISSQTLAKAFIQAFTRCGGTASLTTYPARDRDFRPVLRRALAGKPDLLFLPNPSKEVVLQGLAARAVGFQGKLLGGDSWNGPEISRLSVFRGSTFVDHWREDGPGDRTRAYAAAFRQAGNGPPTEIGALTQDAVDVVLAAVTRAGSTDPQAVTKALMDLPPFDGVTGHFDFVDDGNPVKSLCITRVGDGHTRLETVVLSPPAPCKP